MHSATRLTVATFGALAGLAGIEHGIGETLQGSRAPDSVMIESWPDSAVFRVLAGEPAMTIVPNLRLTGILAILVSLILIGWATLFAQRRHGGLVLILLSIVLLLVGGGFGPPLLGLILGIAATRIGAQPGWWLGHLARDARRVLSTIWPWLFAAGLSAWLLLFPGSILLDSVVGVSNPDAMIYTLILAAFALLLLTLLTALAHDAEPQAEVRSRAG